MNSIPIDFDWQTYLQLHPDLLDAGINDKRQAENHYINHGKDEKRPYKNYFTPIELDKNQKITNVYHDRSHSGIGDFLRGSFYLKEISDKSNSDFNMSFDNHAIGKYISSQHKTHIEQKDIFDLSIETEKQFGLSYRLDHMHQLLQKTIQYEKRPYINSMYCELLRTDLITNRDRQLIHKRFEKHSLDPESQKFFQSNIIFSDTINSLYNIIQNIYRIQTNYIVVHCRFGDRKIINSIDITEDEILNQTNFKEYKCDIDSIVFDMIKYQHIHQLPVFLLCDDNDFKNYAYKIFCQYGIADNLLICHQNSNHCASSPGLLYHFNHVNNISDEQLILVALDLKILSQSKHIYSYSVYPWGSGFSYSMAKIYNIPIEIQII